MLGVELDYDGTNRIKNLGTHYLFAKNVLVLLFFPCDNNFWLNAAKNVFHLIKYYVTITRNWYCYLGSQWIYCGYLLVPNIRVGDNNKQNIYIMRSQTHYRASILLKIWIRIRPVFVVETCASRFSQCCITVQGFLYIGRFDE